MPSLPLRDKRALAATRTRPAMTLASTNRIMIFGPKDDGTYVVEFRTAEAGDLDPAQ